MTAQSEPESETQSDPEIEALLGSVIDDKYRVDALLGVGGMGAVYRVHHMGLRRVFALKVLRPELTSHSEVARRFDREAQSAARLEHPNCLRVTDFGTTDDGLKYMVMELLSGHELTDVLEAGALPPERVVSLLLQIVRGLEHAHEHGIVHRDIKPENVFVTRDHEDRELLKLVDFGIAKMLEGELEGASPKLTRAGMVFGTPRYMSPEQAAGGEIDHRSDLYSVGVMAYQMLAGRVPFDSDDLVRVLRQQIIEPPPPLPETVPEELRAIVERLLAKEREGRFEDAAALVEALKDYRAAHVPGASVTGPIPTGAPPQTPTGPMTGTSPMGTDPTIAGAPTGPIAGTGPVGTGPVRTSPVRTGPVRTSPVGTDPTLAGASTGPIAGTDPVGTGSTLAGAPASPAGTGPGVPSLPTLVPIAPPAGLGARLRAGLEAGLGAGLERVRGASWKAVAGGVAGLLALVITCAWMGGDDAPASPDEPAHSGGGWWPWGDGLADLDDDALEAIDDAIVAGRVDEARAELDRMEQEHPEHPHLLWRRARLLARDEEHQSEALATYGRAAKGAPALLEEPAFFAEFDRLLREPALQTEAVQVAGAIGHPGHAFLLERLNALDDPLPWDERKRAAEVVRAHPECAELLDARRQVIQDLQQASQAEDSCAEIAAALKKIKSDPDQAYHEPVHELRLPRKCKEHKALLAEVRAMLTEKYGTSQAAKKRRRCGGMFGRLRSGC